MRYDHELHKKIAREKARKRWAKAELAKDAAFERGLNDRARADAFGRELEKQAQDRENERKRKAELDAALAVIDERSRIHRLQYKWRQSLRPPTPDYPLLHIRTGKIKGSLRGRHGGCRHWPIADYRKSGLGGDEFFAYVQGRMFTNTIHHQYCQTERAAEILMEIETT